MTSDKLVLSYLIKSKARLTALETYLQLSAFSDVVREAQECVELLLKATLRSIGLEIPKIHDVSKTLLSNQDKLPASLSENISKICAISRSLRKDRELSFYGTEDWIPTDEYSKEDAIQAIVDCRFVYQAVEKALKE